MKRLVVVAIVLLAGLAFLQVQMNRNFPTEKSYDEEKQEQKQQELQAQKDAEFAANLKSTLVTWEDAEKAKGPIVSSKTGLKYVDMKVGTGDTCKDRDVVAVNYAGFLEGGKPFDASYRGKDSKAASFNVAQVIPGFREGLMGMKVGGRRKLMIPSKIGYGNRKAGPIPPNSNLIFVVDLLGVKHDTREE